MPRILWIDGNRESIDKAIALFEGVDYVIVPAHTAVEALELLDKEGEGFNGAVLDVTLLKDDDGLGLLAALCATAPPLPVVEFAGCPTHLGQLISARMDPAQRRLKIPRTLPESSAERYAFLGSLAQAFNLRMPAAVKPPAPPPQQQVPQQQMSQQQMSPQQMPQQQMPQQQMPQQQMPQQQMPQQQMPQQQMSPQQMPQQQMSQQQMSPQQMPQQQSAAEPGRPTAVSPEQGRPHVYQPVEPEPTTAPIPPRVEELRPASMPPHEDTRSLFASSQVEEIDPSFAQPHETNPGSLFPSPHETGAEPLFGQPQPLEEPFSFAPSRGEELRPSSGSPQDDNPDSLFPPRRNEPARTSCAPSADEEQPPFFAPTQGDDAGSLFSPPRGEPDRPSFADEELRPSFAPPQDEWQARDDRGLRPSGGRFRLRGVHWVLLGLYTLAVAAGTWLVLHATVIQPLTNRLRWTERRLEEYAAPPSPQPSQRKPVERSTD